MEKEPSDKVSRRRYAREQAARLEAERILEAKSRELFEANERLSRHAEVLENAVADRTGALKKALEKAKTANELRSRFIATMSHEIRTPLGGLLGMLDLLARDEENEEKLDYINQAKFSGQSLKRIVNDVLDLSKMETGTMRFEREPVDLNTIVSNVVAMEKVGLAGQERDIRFEVSNAVPRPFWGDVSRIRQVLANLVSNAVRYSEDGPVNVRVDAVPNSIGAVIRVEVEDFGIGIDPSQRDKLFEDFSQIQNSLTQQATSSGLGLAVSRRIVEACGGMIDVESAIGKGSIFWFELPVETCEFTQGDLKKPSDVSFPEPRKIIAGARVLLAEDNIVNQKLLTKILTHLDVDVTLVKNGLEAVEAFQVDAFDGLIMDVSMPVMNGLDAAERIIQKCAGVKTPPILLLTAHVRSEIQERADQLGVKAVLGKPIDVDELEQALAVALAQNQADSSQSNAYRPSVLEKDEPQVAGGLHTLLNEDEMAELQQEFASETTINLDRIEQGLMSNQLDEVREAAHAIKGSAAMIGHQEIADIANQLNNVCETDKVDTTHGQVVRIKELLGGYI